MKVIPFGYAYDLVADLYGMTPAELQRKDEQSKDEVRRWLAVDANVAIAAVDVRLRPDDRQFLSFRGSDIRSRPDLARAAGDGVSGVVFVNVDAEDHAAVSAFTAQGFSIESAASRVRISFSSVLSRLRRAWLPNGFRIRSAAAVDEDRLFILDNELRHDVPGLDGWRGNREWFHDELTDAPPFDAAAYLVAEGSDCSYEGLVRIWRNPEGPHLGLIGVRRTHRGTPLAAALMLHGLGAASTWGFETFTADVSDSNGSVQPILTRVGTEELSRSCLMIR